MHVAGIGWWSQSDPGWASLAARLRASETVAPGRGGARPAATSLPPNERRRAPLPVLLACEAAGQACAMAGLAPATLPCVFASVHGDLAITHEMCETLARDPRELSPTRFHNSVHNAPAGYWTVATGCHAPSNAVSAWHGSFGAGLLEAAVQACADDVPVLFAACDIAADGPLARVVDARDPFAVALVLAPGPVDPCLARLALRHVAEPAERNADPAFAALPLLRAIALGASSTIRIACGEGHSLDVGVGR